MHIYFRMADPKPLCMALLLQVRKYLHVVLCFSPVGDKFRIRARQFPALVNCTMFDWFHGWPGEALVSVAQRFLADVPNVDEGVRDSIANHMAYAHQCVTEASVRYQESVRRFNYTTPKSYLELISLYKMLLAVSLCCIFCILSRMHVSNQASQVANIDHAAHQVVLVAVDTLPAVEHGNIGRELHCSTLCAEPIIAFFACSASVMTWSRPRSV